MVPKTAGPFLTKATDCLPQIDRAKVLKPHFQITSKHHAVESLSYEQCSVSSPFKAALSTLGGTTTRPTPLKPPPRTLAGPVDMGCS